LGGLGRRTPDRVSVVTFITPVRNSKLNLPADLPGLSAEFETTTMSLVRSDLN
jgi:hypothetical protein